MSWTETELQVLPEKKGFRLRGTEMTRLETFSDAAFAFATTMLVISVNTIPGSYDELMQALQGVPAFGLSFVQIMMFWIGHRAWSRRYGLEDTPSTITSLALIFIMFVYVYPLRLIFSALFAWLSQGWLPSEFGIQNRSELAGLFVVYGLGFSALSGSLAVLYLRAKSAAKSLGLNSLERVRTSEEVVSWSLICPLPACSRPPSPG